MSMLTSRPSEYPFIPHHLTIPGLIIRNFQGESDFPGMQMALNAARIADHEERFTSSEQFSSDFNHFSGNLYQDVFVAEIQREIVAYSLVEQRFETAAQRRIYFLYGVVRPDWRCQGLGRALLLHNQQHSLELARTSSSGSTASSQPDVYQAHTNSFQPGCQAMLESEGYQMVRQGYSMRRPNLEDLPDLPLPAGIEVRPVRPEQYRQIWEASQEAFRDHWGYTEPTEQDFENWLSSHEFQPDLYQVAWEGDQVAGMIQNFINPVDNEKFGRKRGYTEGICVRRPWRKRGLARALLARSLKMHRDLGMTETALGVDASNPFGAAAFYQSMGYQIWRTHFTYQKALPEFREAAA